MLPAGPRTLRKELLGKGSKVRDKEELMGFRYCHASSKEQEGFSRLFFVICDICVFHLILVLVSSLLSTPALVFLMTKELKADVS